MGNTSVSLCLFYVHTLGIESSFLCLSEMSPVMLSTVKYMLCRGKIDQDSLNKIEKEKKQRKKVSAT